MSNGSRPISRVLSDPGLRRGQFLTAFTAWQAQPSSPGMGDHLSGRHVTTPLVRPTRRSRETSRLPLATSSRMRITRALRLLGLAPGEGCLATGIAAGPGGLLHRRFTLTSRDLLVRLAVVFCGPVRGSPRPGVTRHPAMWSADFPQSPREGTAIARPTDRWRVSYPIRMRVLVWSSDRSLTPLIRCIC